MSFLTGKLSTDPSKGSYGKSRARDGMPKPRSFLVRGFSASVPERGMRNKTNSLPWKMNRLLSVPCVLTAWKEGMVALSSANYL